MKAITIFGILASASLALAFTGDGKDHEHAQDASKSCCAPASIRADVRVSYLERAEPLPDDAKTAKVRGVVKFAGEERPDNRPLVIGDEAARGCTDGPPVDTTNPTLLIDKDGGIKYAVVTVRVDDAKVKVPDEAIVLDQVQCRFEPHILLVPAGATVEYHNSDKVSHNVHTHAQRNPSFNKMVAAGAHDTQKLEHPEAIKITCDIHPWMHCFLFVSDSPYAAVTNADGSFEIGGLPVGTHRAEVWHQSLGTVRNVSVTVAEDGTVAPLEVEMGGDAGGRGGRRRR